MRTVIIAPKSGFCFGVKRATDTLQDLLKEAKPNEKIYTLGHLIHNEAYIAKLEKEGVFSIEPDQLEEISSKATQSTPTTLLVRAHGITCETEEKLKALAEKNPYFKFVDCTCPFVTKIHTICSGLSPDDDILIVMGTEKHPEVQGFLSCFHGEKYVFETPEQLRENIDKIIEKNVSSKSLNIVAQTTYNLCKWEKSCELLKQLFTKLHFYGTICSVTADRQTNAEQLSKKCDAMLVIGGRESSNTEKLYRICAENCPQTFRLCSAGDADGLTVSGNQIGIVAGASTPEYEIQEVYKKMSELNEFEELLKNSQPKTLNTGDVVTGIVTHVDDNEIQLDLGAAQTGYIKADQVSDDATKLTDAFKVGDTVEAFVIRVSDIEGVAELSKKRVDSDRNWFEVVNAEESKTILTGTVAQAVKGGVVINYNANRVFVPASQTNLPKDADLAQLVGKTVRFKVIEVKNGKKAVGSIRIVEREEKKAKEQEFWANIEEGKTYHGTVRNLTQYGAFVDLGGVDGMVHVTELSWKHIKNPGEVVKIGDEIDVFVKSFNKETRKISLGYKTEETNPWVLFKAQYAVGDVVPVKIVNMMPFGAFAQIIDGVDGLIHISQISTERINRPADLLSIGQLVDAKIIEIDDEKQKVGLSIRVLLEEAAQAEENPETVAETETATEEQ